MFDCYEDDTFASSLHLDPRLPCLLPDRLDRRDDKIGSIELNVVSAVLRNDVLTVGRKRRQILL